MKNKVAALALIGWFFGFQMVSQEVEGVHIVTVIGPFTSQEQCNEYRDHVEFAFAMNDVKLEKLTECNEKSDA